MIEPFRTTRRVEFGDTDMAGIVHFANFFRYMESAETAFMRARGLSVSMQFGGERIGFPRVSVKCDYIRPAKFEDVLDIDVILEKVGRKSLVFRFDFSLLGQPIAKGEITVVCCRKDGAGGIESIDIPPEIRDKLTTS